MPSQNPSIEASLAPRRPPSRARLRLAFAAAFGASLASPAAQAETLLTHRIPLALAVEAANATVAACAKQGYHESAAVLDADGRTIAILRGDETGPHTTASAFDKAYTAATFKADTIALAERAKGEDGIAPLAKLPHVMFFGGGVVIKLGGETIGAIGAAGAPGAKLDDACAHAGLDAIKDALK